MKRESAILMVARTEPHYVSIRVEPDPEGLWGTMELENWSLYRTAHFLRT